MLSKKAVLFMLKPASKMMGGSSHVMKNSKSNVSCSRSEPACGVPKFLKAVATMKPISTPTPASGIHSMCALSIRKPMMNVPASASTPTTIDHLIMCSSQSSSSPHPG